MANNLLKPLKKLPKIGGVGGGQQINLNPGHLRNISGADNLDLPTFNPSIGDQIAEANVDINQAVWQLNSIGKSQRDIIQESDTRNWLNKFLGFKEDTSLAINVLDLLNRPANTLRGLLIGYDATGTYNPLQAMEDGLTNRKEYNSFELLKTIGIDTTNWSPYLRIPFSIGIDIATDPLTYWNAPLKMLGQGIKNGTKALTRTLNTYLKGSFGHTQTYQNLMNVTNNLALGFKRAFGLYKYQSAKYLGLVNTQQDAMLDYARSLMKQNMFKAGEEFKTLSNNLKQIFIDSTKSPQKLNDFYELVKLVRPQYKNAKELLHGAKDIDASGKVLRELKPLGTDANDWIKLANELYTRSVETGFKPVNLKTLIENKRYKNIKELKDLDLNNPEELFKALKQHNYKPFVQTENGVANYFLAGQEGRSFYETIHGMLNEIAQNKANYKLGMYHMITANPKDLNNAPELKALLDHLMVYGNLTPDELAKHIKVSFIPRNSSAIERDGIDYIKNLTNPENNNVFDLKATYKSDKRIKDLPQDNIAESVYKNLSGQKRAKYYPYANTITDTSKKAYKQGLLKTQGYKYKNKAKKNFFYSIKNKVGDKEVWNDIELVNGYAIKPLKNEYKFNLKNAKQDVPLKFNDDIMPMLLYQNVDGKNIPKKIIFGIFADDPKDFIKTANAIKKSTVNSFEDYFQNLKQISATTKTEISAEQWDEIFNNFYDNFSKFKDDLPIYNLTESYGDKSGFLMQAFKNDVLSKELYVEAVANGSIGGWKMPIPDEISNEISAKVDRALKDLEEASPQFKTIKDFNPEDYNPEGATLIFSDELTNLIERSTEHMNTLTALRPLNADSLLNKLNFEASHLADKTTGKVAISKMALSSTDIQDIKRINNIYAYMQRYPNSLGDLSQANLLHLNIDDELTKLATSHKVIDYSKSNSMNLSNIPSYDVRYEPETLQQVYEFASLLAGNVDPLTSGKVDVFTYLQKNSSSIGLTKSKQLPFFSLGMNETALKQVAQNQKRVNDAIIKNFTNVFSKYGYGVNQSQKVFLAPQQLASNNMFNDILPHFYNLSNYYESNRAAFFRYVDDSFGTQTQMAKAWRDNYSGYVPGVMNPDVVASRRLRQLLENKANENTINGALNLYNGGNLEKKLTLKSWHAPLSSTNSFVGQELFNSDAFIAQAVQFGYSSEAFKRIKLLETTQQKELVKLIHKDVLKNDLKLDRDPTISEVLNYVRDFKGWNSEFKIMDATELAELRKTVSLNDALSISDADNMLNSWFNDLEHKLKEGYTLAIHDASMQFLKASIKQSKVFSKNPNKFWGFLDKVIVSPFKRLATFTAGFHGRNIVTNYMNGYLAGFSPWDMAKFQKVAIQKVNSFHAINKKVIEELASNPVFRNVTNLQQYNASLRKILSPEEHQLFIEFLELYKKGVLGSTRLSDDTLHYYDTVLKAFKNEPIGGNILPDKFKKLKEFSNLSYEFSIKQDETSKLAAYYFGHTPKGQKAMANLNLKTPEDYAKFMFFDYNNLTPIENNIMKKIFPFYTWARKNFEFHLRNFASNSSKYTRLIQTYNGWRDAFITDPNQEVDYIKYSKLPVLENNGKVTYISFPLTLLNIPEVLLGKDIVANLNPLFKWPIERILGIDLSMLPSQKKKNQWQYLPFGLDSFFNVPRYVWDSFTSKEPSTVDVSNVGLLGSRFLNVVKSMKNWLTIGDPDFNPALFLPSFFTEYDTNKIVLNNKLEQIAKLNNYINALRQSGKYVPSIKDILPNAYGTVNSRLKVVSPNFTLEQLNKLVRPIWQRNYKR